MFPKLKTGTIEAFYEDISAIQAGVKELSFRDVKDYRDYFKLKLNLHRVISHLLIPCMLFSFMLSKVLVFNIKFKFVKVRKCWRNFS